MRMRLTVIFIVTAILALPSYGQSKGDWKTVRRIDRGRLITVKVPNKVHCTFVDANDDKLFCDEADSFRLEINRTDIREVRLELTEEDNAFVNRCIGAAIGIGAGAISNAIRPNEGVFEPITGLQGALIVGILFRRAHFVHGRVIYKR